MSKAKISHSLPPTATVESVPIPSFLSGGYGPTPDHRWQIPLPQNLLQTPENFDPGDTRWKIPPIPSVGVDTNALITESGVDGIATESGDILEFE
jgi:hypothetical protein